MKTSLYFQTLAAVLALSGTLRAQDTPQASIQVSVSKPEVTISDPRTRDTEHLTGTGVWVSGHPTGPVTWLGLAADPAPGDVLAQLPVEQGCGLVVRYVSEDSPAEKAGVQVNDVLTHLGDQILVNSDQLKFLVGSHKAGDAVQLTAYRHGKEVTFSAQLESKTLPPEEAIKLGGAGPAGKEWNAVSSLPPDAQRAIKEAMSGKSPVSISGSVTVTGPDGKQIVSTALPDMNTISQLLKLSSSLIPKADSSSSPGDAAAILKAAILKNLQQEDRKPGADSDSGNTPAPAK